MLNRVGSPEPNETPRRPGQPGHEEKRPGPSPHSPHPTGPAPPFDEREVEPPQGDADSAGDRRKSPASGR